MAPKSNASYKALAAARAEVRERGAATPPDYLRDGHYPGAGSWGGARYRYAHDEPDGVGDQPLLPQGLEGRAFYAPTDRGFEASSAPARGSSQAFRKYNLGATSTSCPCFKGGFPS